MINAELLYKLNFSDSTYKQVGIQHFPRHGGKATGAHPRVIIRALRELFLYQRTWKQAKKKTMILELQHKKGKRS